MRRLRKKYNDLTVKGIKHAEELTRHAIEHATIQSHREKFQQVFERLEEIERAHYAYEENITEVVGMIDMGQAQVAEFLKSIKAA